MENCDFSKLWLLERKKVFINEYSLFFFSHDFSTNMITHDSQQWNPNGVNWSCWIYSCGNLTVSTKTAVKMFAKNPRQGSVFGWTGMVSNLNWKFPAQSFKVNPNGVNKNSYKYIAKNTWQGRVDRHGVFQLQTENAFHKTLRLSYFL